MKLNGNETVYNIVLLTLVQVIRIPIVINGFFAKKSTAVDGSLYIGRRNMYKNICNGPHGANNSGRMWQLDQMSKAWIYTHTYTSIPSLYNVETYCTQWLNYNVISLWNRPDKLLALHLHTLCFLHLYNITLSSCCYLQFLFHTFHSISTRQHLLLSVQMKISSCILKKYTIC